MTAALSKTAPLDILIVKLSAIGDVVHTLAFLDVLHRNFPQARIDWLVEEGAAGIIEEHPAIHAGDRIEAENLVAGAGGRASF